MFLQQITNAMHLFIPAAFPPARTLRLNTLSFFRESIIYFSMNIFDESMPFLDEKKLSQEINWKKLRRRSLRSVLISLNLLQYLKIVEVRLDQKNECAMQSTSVLIFILYAQFFLFSSSKLILQTLSLYILPSPFIHS